MLIEKEMIVFPFPVGSIEVTFDEILKRSPERSYILAIDSEKSLSGMAWSDSQEAYFVYVPELHPKKRASIAINFGVDLSGFAFNVRMWSKAASQLSEVCGSVAVTARGIAGEEQREYEITYKFGSDA